MPIRGGVIGGGAVAVLLVAAAAQCGCSRGVRWQFGTFQDVHRASSAAGKLTFVYFRSWYRVECTDFEENVLKNPEVLTETESMTCVPLDFDYDRPLARRWQLEEPPAYVIVAPEGHVLARGMGDITLEELLEGIRSAKGRFAGAPQPAQP